MKFTRRSAILGGSIAVVGLGSRFPCPALATEKAVNLALPYELSGRFVAFGQAGDSGARLAMETIHRRNSKVRIEPIYRDIQSDVSSATSVMSELLTNQDIRFLVGPIASVLIAATIPIWQRRKVLWICPGGTTPIIEQEIGKEPFFFHTYAYSYSYHQTAAKYLSDLAHKGQKRFSILCVDDGYGRSQLPYVEKYYPEAGFEIVAKELIHAGTLDMGPPLAKIAAAKPDVLLALVQTSDAITMAKQVYTRKISIPYLLGTAFTELDEWQMAVGEAQQGWMGITSFVSDMQRPANTDYPDLFPTLAAWVERFRARFNTEPTALALSSYVSVALFSIALERAGSDSMEAVAAELRKIDVPTPNGQAHFRPTGFGTLYQAFDNMVVFQRTRGKNVVVYPPEIATGIVEPVRSR